MTVALPLSAGNISIELSFFKSFIALYSSVVILEGGGLALVSAPIMFIGQVLPQKMAPFLVQFQLLLQIFSLRSAKRGRNINLTCS